jgi:hypothetical protein
MPEFEYAFLWIGGESGRPWGTKAQGYVQSPQLNRPSGVTISNVTIAGGSETGNNRTLTVDVTLEVGKWVGAELRLGSAASPLGGVFTITQNAALSVTGNWSATAPAASSGTFPGFIVFPDQESYEEVRVLVPYQPEGDTTNTVPYPNGDVIAAGEVAPFDHLGNALILPTPVTAYTDWGLFLPFTFKEGIAGFGISDATDSRTVPAAHACQGATDTTFDWSNPATIIPADVMEGGYIRCTHQNGVSWARILTDDGATPTAQFVLADPPGWTSGTKWLGNGTPATGAAFPATTDFIYEAWAPHYDNNPYAYLPGPGFRYPSNDMQPSYSGNGRILNLPKAHDTSSYGDRYGAMLEFGYRMSASLGKRVNMIQLAVNDTTLIPRTTQNTDGFRGTLGWWDSKEMSDWAPAKANGLAARVNKLITTIAPNALLAEGSTKLLRILGIVFWGGEEDATIAAGRESYSRTLPDFVHWIRGVIDAAGLNPYQGDAKVPVVHPRLTALPWEDTPFDEDQLINAATCEIMEADGFGDTILTDDSPKLASGVQWFNGVGEGLNGNLSSLAMQSLVNRALGHGSPIIEAATVNTTDVDVCNMALSHLGEQLITDLDTDVDTTVEASRCALFYPLARDEVLEARAWGFAMQRKSMVPAAADPPSTWNYSYVVPPEALSPFTVLHPEADDDYASSTVPLTVTSSDNYWIGSVGAEYTPQPYAIEQAPGGHRVIHTNIQNAVLRYSTKALDPAKWSNHFKTALSYKLAALLAGVTMSGKEGSQKSREMIALYEMHLGKAGSTDGRHRMARPRHLPPHIAQR